MDDAVLPVALSDARPSSTHGSAPIPQVLSTFLGRVRETRAGLRLLAASEMRLLTILGPAGVGKTRFAQHLITRYLATFPERERIVWVDLTSATSDDLVAAIATAVGAGEGGCASTFDGICVAPSARPVILVLDTMEHLSGSGKLIADLLAATPTLRCLVTSQTPLHLRGEQLFRLPPLSLPERDAVRGHRI